MDLIGLRGATVPSGGPQIDMAGARTAIIVNPPLCLCLLRNIRGIDGEPYRKEYVSGATSVVPAIVVAEA